MHNVVNVLNGRQEKVLHKMVLHSAMQMAADRNIKNETGKKFH
jgi:hypothetical protein